MVADYNAEIKGNVDAEYFVDYYAAKGKWPADWRAYLRVWNRNHHSDGRINKPKRAASKRNSYWGNNAPQNVLRCSEEKIMELWGLPMGT